MAVGAVVGGLVSIGSDLKNDREVDLNAALGEAALGAVGGGMVAAGRKAAVEMAAKAFGIDPKSLGAKVFGGFTVGAVVGGVTAVPEAVEEEDPGVVADGMVAGGFGGLLSSPTENNTKAAGIVAGFTTRVGRIAARIGISAVKKGFNQAIKDVMDFGRGIFGGEDEGNTEEGENGQGENGNDSDSSGNGDPGRGEGP